MNWGLGPLRIKLPWRLGGIFPVIFNEVSVISWATGAKLPFKKAKNDATIYDWQYSIFDDNSLDLSNGCEESCEVY